MKISIFFVLIYLFSCRGNDNCDSIEINSDIDSLTYQFKVKVENPFKMDSEVTWRWNDTIILNGFKVGPLDTNIISLPSDFYGKPDINFSYQKYKATIVDIKYTYCFY